MRTSIEEKIKTISSHNIIPIIIIIIASLVIRIYFTPWGNVAEASDTLEYLVRSLNFSNGYYEDIVYNPIWPFALSIVFSIYNFENILEYFDIMRVTSLIISLLTIPIIFLIARNYTKRKYAYIATIFFAFEPNLIQNSIWAITEPIFILFSMIGFLFLINKNSRYFLLSFVFAGIAFETRFFGIVLLVLSIIGSMLRFKNKNTGIKFAIIGIGIFAIISLPYTIGTLEQSSEPFLNRFNEVERNLTQINPHLINPGGGIFGIQDNNFQENDDQYWVIKNAIIKEVIHIIRILIPYLIIFVPIGIIFVFKEMNYQKQILILGIIISILIGIPQYTSSAVFRNLFLLIPMFCFISSIGLERILNGKQSQQKILAIITIFVIVSSIIFLNGLSPDYEELEEKNEFGKYVTNEIQGVIMGNDLDFIRLHMINVEDIKINHSSNGEIVLKSSQFALLTKNDLENFIMENNVTHIVVNDKLDNRYFVFEELRNNIDNYPYLHKVMDSEKQKFVKYKVTIFEVEKELIQK